MNITTSSLKPEHVVKLGDGTINNYPKVIERAMSNCLLEWHPMTGLNGDIWLCKPCTSQLEYSEGGLDFTNGTFRVRHGEGMYIEAHYYREEELPIAGCLSCGAARVTGYRYRISIGEITYADEHLRVFDIGDQVTVQNVGLGKITGWTDEREQYRRYHITFPGGLKGKYVHWQLRKD